MKTKLSEVREEIEVRAADFLQRRRFGDWAESDDAELRTWLAESEARRIAFWRLEIVQGRVDRLAALRSPVKKRASRVLPLRIMVPYLASAAALGLFVVLGVAAERYFLRVPDRIYSTTIGGRALLNFADRTQIELNTNSVVRYRMTNEERTVWLEKGEAWFRVAHNAANPFTVVIGKHRVTDLGTEFVVRRDPSGTDVTLLKGRAAFSTEGAQTAMLTPGDEAIATPISVTVTHKTPQQIADELAWQHGMLVFRNTRLADAVREFNRYNETKLVIIDPAIADLKIGGGFKTDDTDDFLKLAQAILKLRVDREGNDILLSRDTRDERRVKRITTRTVRP